VSPGRLALPLVLLLFYSERYGKAGAEIMVMDADGADVVRVTRDPWYSALPRWQPAP
jgi:Tol biopolymer transport system component